MATMPVPDLNARAVEMSKVLEDPLAHLPRSRVWKFDKGETIYNSEQPPGSLYLVIDGRVKVSRLANNGDQVLIDIYKCDELFGESVFLNSQLPPDQAIALEDTDVMSWPARDVQEIVLRCPRLGIALLQLVVRRSTDLSQRIESFSIDNVPRRLARSLIRFSERLGIEQEDGSVRMPAFPHHLLSEYVGTSREIVTSYMNNFRKQGYVRYSRAEVVVYREQFSRLLENAA